MIDWTPAAGVVAEQLCLDPDGAVATACSGGQINKAYSVDFKSGERIFLKINSADKVVMFESESEGLVAISDTKTVRVPEVVATGSVGNAAFLALEHLPLGRGSDEAEAKLGRQLALLHRNASPGGKFGWHRDNTIGTTFQPNPPTDSWIDFYREQRLEYQLHLSAKKGLRLTGIKTLCSEFASLFGDYEPIPSLLHGDLWRGNAGFVNDIPVVFDPACYYGDREADLAFTEMFGGFGSAFYEGYQKQWPTNAGYEIRKHLYNLYHVLNHNYLFGGYAGQAQEIVDQLNAEL